MQLNFHLTTSQVFTIFHSRIFCIPAFFYYYYNKHLLIKQRKIDRVNDPYFGQFSFRTYKNIHIYFSFQLKKKKNVHNFQQIFILPRKIPLHRDRDNSLVYSKQFSNSRTKDGLYRLVRNWKSLCQHYFYAILWLVLNISFELPYAGLSRATHVSPPTRSIRVPLFSRTKTVRRLIL